MLGFSALILVVLWLFQIVLLPNIYKFIMMNEIKDASYTLAEAADSEDIDAIAKGLHEEGRYCISMLYFDGRDMIFYHAQDNCAIHSSEPRTEITLLNKLYQNAKLNNGEIVYRFNQDAFWAFLEQITSSNLKDFFGSGNAAKAGEDESIIYTVVTPTVSGEDVMVVVNSLISPVDATVNTLSTIFFFIAGVIVILALLLSLIISRRISKPIIEISNSAKILAEGRYDVNFRGRGYREAGELADTLNYAAEELSKVDNLKTELIANISHDLRTPLTMISGYSEIMRDLPGENTPENCQIIIDEAKRLTSLVNDVLDISKLQSGTQEMNMEPLCITEAVEAAMERYAKLREVDGYVITFAADRKATVMADRTRIMQVVYNLVNNAVTYTGADKTVRIIQSCEDGKVRISVTDSGEGIEADKLALIWDRYYKVDKVHKRAAMGTGLGLSIVRSITHLHGGSCGVESTLGVGSTFWFELDEYIPEIGDGNSKTVE
ncbi:MAG: HAMP domain-containing histidine kinase [Clostridia bacterium]|nr:HAMP domain-containing histidine kinase [Clostridia bacterium]